MTAQMRDRIKYEGKDYGLSAAPLEGYFGANPAARPKFNGMNSACMRGYIADWEVRRGKLFLVGMEMVLQTDATFASVFPGAGQGGVFAEWVSGELKCPYGKLLRYDHAGFSSLCEHELALTVENGVVKGTATKDNA
jgi:hypothetical protein